MRSSRASRAGNFRTGATRRASSSSAVSHSPSWSLSMQPFACMGCTSCQVRRAVAEIIEAQSVTGLQSGASLIWSDPMKEVDELVARGDAEALAKLAEGSDKAVAKAARRGLHKLRSQGMKVAAPQIVRETPSAPVRAAAAELPSLASSIDAAGERAIWLARSERDGVLVFEAYVHEQNGLTQFRTTELGRKQWRKLVRELSEPKPHF